MTICQSMLGMPFCSRVCKPCMQMGILLLTIVEPFDLQRVMSA